jgi:hypothetical protein
MRKATAVNIFNRYLQGTRIHEIIRIADAEEKGGISVEIRVF